MGKKVLAFDFGGSTGRALIGGINEDGILSYKEIARFDNIPIQYNGNMCWNFDKLFEEIKNCLIHAKIYDYCAIGIDTWGVDYGLIDKDGNLISPPIHYRDERTICAKEKLNQIISSDRLYSITGIQDMRINTIYQLYSDKINGNLEKADKILFMPDLFAYFLTGNKFNEYSIATTSSMLDSANRIWSEEILNAIGIEKNLFPQMLNSGESYGMLSDKICEELKISSVPVVAVCGHDTASAIMAIPTISKSPVYISCGTWSLMGTLLDNPRFDNPNFTNEGGANKKITYLSNIMGLWIMQETRRIWKSEIPNLTFSDMDNFMVSDSSNIECYINPNDEAFVAPASMPSAIIEYVKKTQNIVLTKKGDIVACIYKSLAKNYLSTYRQLNIDSDIFIIGGGSKSEMLCQITADITGVPVHSGPSEATAIGNILSSLLYLGEISHSQIGEIIRKSESVKTFHPTMPL